MKILYVITGLGGGGAEKVVANLADKMMGRGHIVKIAYLKGSVVVKPQSTAIELVYLGFENIQNIYTASKKYRKLVREFQPDVVHAHMVHANIFARLNRIGCNIPKLICTAHNSNEGGKLRMLGYRLTNGLSDLNTNVSFEALQRFINIRAFDHKAICIYNGISLDYFKYNKALNLSNNDISSKKIVLAVGRLNIQKDYPNLLYALRMILDNYSIGFKVLIVGDGEEKENLEHLVKKLDLTEYVNFLGRRDDIPQLMSMADVFVLSSAFEGFGLVVAEAMACETFVVATDCGGVKEVMGGCGILVPPKDSQRLAEGLYQALTLSKEQKNKNNQEALTYVREHFDLEKIVTQWEKLYVQ